MIRNKKKWIQAGIVILIILLAGGAIYMKKVMNYQEKVQHIVIHNVDISAKADGVYIGTCDADLISATVEVTVYNGKITKIHILQHKNGRGKPAEAVLDNIIKEQKIKVDAVSGATNSSIVLEKAVENALNT